MIPPPAATGLSTELAILIKDSSHFIRVQPTHPGEPNLFSALLNMEERCHHEKFMSFGSPFTVQISKSSPNLPCLEPANISFYHHKMG